MTDKTIQKANPNVDDIDALVRRTMFANQPADLVNMTLLICQRYDLDPLLKHVVLIKGNIYVTRDGLLHVAHQSGQLNGMHVTLGKDDFGMFAECTIYRRDMEHPFTYRVYRDEYDSKTGAWRTHPRAMLIKTAEVFTLRRAFDVALTPIEEMGTVDTVIDRHQPDPPSRPASTVTQAQPIEGEVVEEPEPKASPKQPPQTVPPPWSERKRTKADEALELPDGEKRMCDLDGRELGMMDHNGPKVVGVHSKHWKNRMANYWPDARGDYRKVGTITVAEFMDMMREPSTEQGEEDEPLFPDAA